MLSAQPGLRGSNDLRVGRKMATFQLFFQSGRANDLSAPLYRRMGAPQSRTERVQKMSPSSGFDSQTVQPVASRYAVYAFTRKYGCELRFKLSSVYEGEWWQSKKTETWNLSENMQICQPVFHFLFVEYIFTY